MDVVLTTVPQSAMTVLAEETNQTEEVNDAGSNETSDTTPTSNDSQDASDVDSESDSDSTDDEDTPSDSSAGGGSESTENSEDETEADETAGNNETPAISESVEKDEADAVEEPVEDEVVEPTTTPELPAESEEPTEDEAPEELETPKDADIIGVDNVTPNAAEQVKPATIAVEQYKDALPTYDKDGNVVKPEPESAEAVEVVYTDGVDGDTAVGGDKPVQFQLSPFDGWTLTDAKLQYEIADDHEDKEGNSVPKTGEPTLSGDTYTIPTNTTTKVEENGKTVTKKCYSGEITLRIAVKTTTAKVKAATDLGKIYFTTQDEEGAEKTDSVTGTTESSAIPFSLFTGETYQVALKASEADTVKVAIGEDVDAEKITCERGDEKTDVEAETGYCWYSFNPSEVPGYDEIANTNDGVFVISKEAGVAKKLSIAVVQNSKATLGDVTGKDGSGEDILDDEDGAVRFIHPATNDDGKYDFSKVADLTSENYGVTVTGSGEEQKEQRNVLVVGVDPADNVNLSGFRAEVKNGDKEPVSLTAESKTYETGEGEEAVTHYYYTIDLSTIDKELFTDNLTLELEALTEYKESDIDDKTFNVHDITFQGENVEIKRSDSTITDYDEATSVTVGTAFRTDDVKEYFAIKADEGYEVTKGTEYGGDEATYEHSVVTVSYEKVYQLTNKEETPEKVYDVKETVEGEEWTLDDEDIDGAYTFNHALFSDDDSKDADWKDLLDEAELENYAEWDKDSETAAKAPWSIRNLVITVKTEAAKDSSGTITVKSPKLEYTVVTGSGVEIGDNKDEYKITDDAEFVIINITSPAGEPTVNYNCNTDYEGGTPATVTGESGAYTAKIPVAKLNKDGDEIDSKINIATKTKSFSVYDLTADDDFAGTIKVGENGSEKDYDEAEKTFEQGTTVPVVLYAEPGTEFASVQVVNVEDVKATPEEITLGENKGEVSLSLVLNNNIEVNVTTKNIYRVDVKYNGEWANEEDGVYVIPVGSKNITAELYSGAGSADENKVELAYAKLYDGSSLAKTKVTKSGNKATITAVDAADAGDLRLALGVKKGSKLVEAASIQIRRDKMAEKMAILDEEGNPVTELTLTPDMESRTFTVKAEDGSLAFSNDTIIAEVVSADGKTEIKDIKANTAVNQDKGKNINVAYEVNGGERTITITPLPSVKGNWSGTLRFYDSAKRKAAKRGEDNICAVEGGTINIATTAPGVETASLNVTALPGTNTEIRLEVSTDAYEPTGETGNAVKYHVTFDAADKVITASKDTYWDVAVNGYYGDGKEMSQVLTIPVLAAGKNGKDNPATEFHPTVTLVQQTDATDTKSKLAVKADAVSLTASTRENRYEHDLTLTNDKASIFIGQKETVVTKAQFSDTTGYADVIKTEFINIKTGRVVTETGFVANPKANGDVTIKGGYSSTYKNHPEYFKDLGLKISAKVPNDSDTENKHPGTDTMAASAILKLDVKQGVYSLRFENGFNQTIWKQPGKAASLTVKTELNYGYKEYKPKKTQFTYALGDADGNLPGDKDYNLSSAVAAAVKVNVKNGKVTVDKNFVPNTKKGEEDKNKFSVVAKELCSGAEETLYVTISDKAQALGNVVIVNEDGKVIASNGGTLKAEDFYQGKKLYVKALTSTAGNKRAYDPNEDYMDGVKYTSSAKTALAVSPVDGRLNLLKIQAKPVKLTIAAADGSKKNSQQIEVNLQGFSAIGLHIENESQTISNKGKCEAEEIKYDGAINEKFTLYPIVKVNNSGKYVSVNTNYFKNFNIKIKNAKKLKLAKTATNWEIVKTNSVTEITISDKSDKGKTKTYRIVQDPQTDVKAPKVRAVTSLTQQMTDAARNAVDEKNGQISVKFQITDKKADNYAKKYIMLTPDYTKVNLLSKQNGTEEWKRSKKIFLRQDSGDYAKGSEADFKTVKIDENGAFTLPVYLWHKTDNEVAPGNYTLIATVGEYANGKFTPLAKSTSVKVKIPGKAPKALTLKVDGNFTLDESGIPVDIADGVSSAWEWELRETGRLEGPVENIYRNYAMNWIDPETGKPNQFNDFFEVKEAKDANGTRVGYTLGIKKGLKVKDLESLQSETSKDRRGYITIVSGQQTMDMEINVTLAASEITAKANDSYVGADVAVRFYANGDMTTPIELAQVDVDQTASEGGAKIKSKTPEKEKDVNGNERSTIARVTLSNAQAGGDYKVTFKILPKDSAYANLDKKQDVAKVGREVTAVLHVCDPANAGSDITIKPAKGEELAFTAYSADDYKSNTYHLQLSFESNIDGADVTKIAVGKTVDGKPFEGDGIILANKTANKIELTMKSDKFLKAAETSKTFKKGAYVDVPLTLSFKNGKLADVDTVVKVKLPNPLSVEEAVKAADQAVKSVNALDPYDTKATASTDIKKNLEKRMSEIINKALPLDSAGKITRPSALSSKFKGEGDDKTEVWQATLTIENPSDKTFTKQEFAIEFNAAKNVVTQSALVSAIRGLTINAEEISKVDGRLDNDYTASDLLRDIKAMLAKKGYDTIPSTLDIEVSTFKITKKATNKIDGSLSWGVTVYDAVTRSKENAGSGKATIPQFGTPITNAEKISTDVNTEMSNVDKFVNDMTDGVRGLEEALSERIKAAAEKARIDKSVTVEFKGLKNSDFTASEWDNLDIDKLADEDTVDVLYKLPTTKTAGKISFKLVITQPGTKPYEIDFITDAVTVVANDKFMSIDEADEKLADIWGIADGQGKYTLLTEIDSNDEGEIQKQIEAQVDECLKGSKLLEREVTVTVDEEATEEKAGTAIATVTIRDKAERIADGDEEYADKEYSVSATIPQKEAVVSGITIGIDRKDDGKAVTTDTVVQGDPATVTINGISTSTTSSVITIKPELEGYWLTDADRDYEIKFYDSYTDDATNTPLSKAGFEADDKGVLTIDPTDATEDDNMTITVYATVSAKTRGEEVYPTEGPRFKKVTITCKFTPLQLTVEKVENFVETEVTDKVKKLAGVSNAEVVNDTFVVTLDGNAGKVEDDARNWVSEITSADSKAAMVDSFTDSFGADWDNVDSVTVSSSMRIFGTTIDPGTHTYHKTQGETIPSFVNRVCKKLDGNVENYLNKMQQKYTEQTNDTKPVTYAILKGAAPTGSITVNVGGVTVTYKLEVK